MNEISAVSNDLFTEQANIFQQRLLQLLREFAYKKQTVTLASGRTSDFYIDCRKVMLTSEGHFLCGWLIFHTINQVCPNISGISGLTMGADPLISATSLISYIGGRPLDGIYVRKEAKKHGTKKFHEGGNRLPATAKIVILEDVVTSGGSALTAVEKIRQAGYDPVHVIALVDRCEGGREKIETQLPLTTLFNRQHFPQ